MTEALTESFKLISFNIYINIGYSGWAGTRRHSECWTTFGTTDKCLVIGSSVDRKRESREKNCEKLWQRL